METQTKRDKRADMFDPNTLESKVLKWILATNYYDNVIAEVEGTEYYSQKLKNLLKQVDAEMRKISKKDTIDQFYNEAECEHYLNNLNTHEAYFKKLSSVSCLELEKEMIKYLEEERYIILSPDGFTFDAEPEIYSSKTQLKKAFKHIARRYASQGYYSSAKYGQIDLADLEDYCTIITL